MVSFDALVLAGGQGRRLGGVDKAELVVDGVRLLDRALAAGAGAERTIVVGPRRRAPNHVLWTREQPPGGGPAAGLAAGLALAGAPVVVVLAVDLVNADAVRVGRLLGALGEADGVAYRDAGGRLQPLFAAYRRDALVRALEGLDPAGAALTAVLAGLRLGSVLDDAACRDLDTWPP
jgi:molybdopterin-guanine dinucleotide biosynthesis protein A